jgi:hypothetical protein
MRTAGRKRASAAQQPVDDLLAGRLEQRQIEGELSSDPWI